MSVNKKGQIIDSRCNIKGELIEYNNKVYSCNLNQTDVDSNKNKFYIMQLIKSNNEHHLFTVYGRNGENGKTGTQSYGSETTGINSFEKLF